MAHQEEQRAARRLFEDLEQCVGGLGIQIVGGIDDRDAPSAIACRPGKKSGDLARVIDADLAS